jgi:hypothetical protein
MKRVKLPVLQRNAAIVRQNLNRSSVQAAQRPKGKGR